MNRISKEDVNNFAQKNNVTLSESELDFTYDFIKKNWQPILANPNMLNFDRYKDKYSPENLEKIKKLFKEYSIKYKNYL